MEEKISSKEINLINKYLSDTVNIIQNQIYPFFSENGIKLDKTIEDNIMYDNFEIELNSLIKINESLTQEIKMISTIKNNMHENRIGFIDGLSKILTKRNALLNDLISLFFSKMNELINKEKKVKRKNIRHNNASSSSLSSGYTINANKTNKSKSNSKSKNKGKDYKIFLTGRKYENMLNYNNKVKDRVKTYKNKSIKIDTSKNKRKNTNNSIDKNSPSNIQSITTTSFNANLNDNNYEDIPKSDENNLLCETTSPIRKNKVVIKMNKKNKFNSYINKTNIELKDNRKNKSKNSSGRTTSVIKEFKNNYNINKKDNLNIGKETGMTRNFFNWDKLNLDKLNEIGINLLTNTNI